MTEIVPPQPFSYREEIVEPLLQTINAGNSCLVIGSASAGKTNLVDFLVRRDVQQHYLGPEADSLWMVRVDCNRLFELTAWGLYELLLTSLIEAFERAGKDYELPDRVYQLREHAITSQDAFLAFRNLESVTRMLVFSMGKRVCFLLDEFDALYKQLPEMDFNHLRALRDQSKALVYGLTYILVTRARLEDLRKSEVTESFSELIDASKSVFALTPYTPNDTRTMISRLEIRNAKTVSAQWCERMVRLSGGHAGLVMALFKLEDAESLPEETNWLEHNSILAACRTLWQGLRNSERAALLLVAGGKPLSSEDAALPKLKGLIQAQDGAGWRIFSPIFSAYVLQRLTTDVEPLWIDPDKRIVYVDGRQVKNLRPLVYKLVEFLYININKVCKRDEICAAIHPEDDPEGVSENSLDALVRDARREIETTRKPRYLLTVHGVGFQLVDRPEKS